MSVFREIERLEDEVNINKGCQAGLTQLRLEKVKACKYRVSGNAMYSIKCKHPERAKGRQCVNLNCPVLHDIIV